MADILSCLLPPKFFAAWYTIMGQLADDGLATRLEDRLTNADVDREWVDAMAAAYGHIATWVVNTYEDPWSEPVEVGQVWFDSAHAALANWFMASDLLYNEDVTSAALQARLHDMIGEVPFQGRGVVIAGTLGQPVSDTWAVATPAIPSTWPQIDGVAEAYSGLLHRLLALEEAETAGRRDELGLTSVLWRLGALVDGMEPKLSDRDGIEQRLGRLTPSPIFLSPAEADLRRVILGFGDQRNVLTHLTPASGMTFSSVVDEHEIVEDVKDRVSLITASMFFKSADQQHHATVPRGEFDRVESDIEMIGSYATL